jgi:hypothetical protein
MKLRLLSFLFATSLIACDNSSTAPKGALIGQWGGQGIELVATTNAIILNAECAAHFSGQGPIIPYEGNRFILSLDLDRPKGSGPNSQSTAAYALSGTISGELITVKLTAITIGGTFAHDYQLIRGAPQGSTQLECT